MKHKDQTEATDPRSFVHELMKRAVSATPTDAEMLSRAACNLANAIYRIGEHDYAEAEARREHMDKPDQEGAAPSDHALDALIYWTGVTSIRTDEDGKPVHVGISLRDFFKANAADPKAEATDKPLTEGYRRAGLDKIDGDLHPGAYRAVKMIGDAMDLIDSARPDLVGYRIDRGQHAQIMRTKAVAMTKLEEASLWVAKALTT